MVAKSLFAYHPTYYFLIDRDTLDDDQVEQMWSSFPDPNSHNTLCWKRREVESYFIDPLCFSKSSFVTATIAEVETELVNIASGRVWHDIARFCAILLSGKDIAWWRGKRHRFTFGSDRNVALSELCNAPLHCERISFVSKAYRIEMCESLFREVELQFLKNNAVPILGLGNWLYMMEASEIFSVLISKFANVRIPGPGGSYKTLKGPEAEIAFVRELISKLEGNKEMPQDLTEVVEAVKTRTR